MRETFKRSHGRYRLRWERALGFVRLAAHAGGRVAPLSGSGVDDTGEERLCPRLTGDGNCRMPLVMGMGPRRLPVQRTFAVGSPLHPQSPDAPEPCLRHFKDCVAASVRRLLVRARHA